MKNITFWTLLGLLFIGFKLGGVINWSWWLVLLPLYGFAAIKLIIWLVLLLIGVGVKAGIDSEKREKIEAKLNQQPAQTKWQQKLEEMQKAQKEKQERERKNK